jgi:hypothetical protein
MLLYKLKSSSWIPNAYFVKRNDLYSEIKLQELVFFCKLTNFLQRKQKKLASVNGDEYFNEFLLKTHLSQKNPGKVSDS